MRIQDLFPIGFEKAATAGFLGAVVYWTMNRKHPKEGMLCLVVGTISAIYLGPVIEPILRSFCEPGSDIPASMSGFICGLTGISLNGLVVDLVNGKARQIRRQDDPSDGGK